MTAARTAEQKTWLAIQKRGASYGHPKLCGGWVKLVAYQYQVYLVICFKDLIYRLGGMTPPRAKLCQPYDNSTPNIPSLLTTAAR